MSVLFACLLGFFMWSLGHYVGHRVFHWMMRHGKGRALYSGENKHHLYYDHPHNQDPYRLFMGFPYFVVLLANLVVAVCLLSTMPPSCVLGLLISYISAMSIDDGIHRLIHEGFRVPLFYRLHMIHHETHRNNFAFCTGLIFDVLFGTFKYNHKA